MKELGQLFFAGVNGSEITPETESFIRGVKPGGIVLFTRNLQGPCVSGFVDSLKSLVRDACAIEPFIAIDHETGTVTRGSGLFSEFPGNYALGICDDRDLAYEQGLVMAEELTSIGVTVNFAPVVDLLTPASTKVMDTRLISSSPQTSTRMAAALAQGMRDGGVEPCAKHFPGLGSAAADTHLSLPLVKKNSVELAEDLEPFQSLINEGLSFVMTGHACYPCVSMAGDIPASLCPRIMKGLLRDKMSYNGIIITDDMYMGALDGSLIHERCERALKAGADMVLLCHPGEQIHQVSSKIELMLQDNGSRRLIEDKLSRIAVIKDGIMRKTRRNGNRPEKDPYGKAAVLSGRIAALALEKANPGLDDTLRLIVENKNSCGYLCAGAWRGTMAEEGRKDFFDTLFHEMRGLVPGLSQMSLEELGGGAAAVRVPHGFCILCVDERSGFDYSKIERLKYGDSGLIVFEILPSLSSARYCGPRVVFTGRMDINRKVFLQKLKSASQKK